jgi:hypothetical protein
MSEANSKHLSHHPSPWELMQFKLLLSVVFSWFLLSAVIGRLSSQRGEQLSESCWQQAKRSAYSVIPYAFMRV